MLTNEIKYSNIIRSKDRTFKLRRLRVQNLNIIDNNGKKSMLFGEKIYSFIPIDEDMAKNFLFSLGNNKINAEFFDGIIKNLRVNNNEIKGIAKQNFK
jgi:hypothetical protein